VLDASGVPLPGCAVVSWLDDSSTLSEGVSDVQGIFSTFSSDSSGGFVARSPEGAVGFVLASPRRGISRLVIGRGQTLTGKLLADGGMAADGLSFEFYTTSWGLPGGVLPDGVQARTLEIWGRRKLVTQMQGGFSVDGLHPTWRGFITPPDGYWFAPSAVGNWSPRQLKIVGPMHIVVALVGLPAVRGFARWADGGSVESGFVVVKAVLEDGVDVYGQAQIMNGGRFLVGLSPSEADLHEAWARASVRPRVARGSLYCSGVPGHDGTAQIPLGVGSLAGDFEVVLERAARTYFIVVDESGAPISGARLDVSAVADCKPTDADGRSSYVGSPPKLIGAEGRAVVPAIAVRGDGSEGSPFEFLLPPRNRIRIEAVSPNGTGLGGIRLAIESEKMLMAGGMDWREFHGSFGGALASCGSRRDRESGRVTNLLNTVVGADGAIELHSIEPGIAGVAVVLDEAMVPLGKAEFVAPPFGASAQIVVTVDRQLVRVRGKVVRADGSPVDQAEIALSVSGGLAAMLRSDAAGRFAFWCAKGASGVQVRLRAPGCVKSIISNVGQGDGDLGVVRMEPSRSVIVRVVDESGSSVDVFAQPLGFEEVEQQQLGLGCWKWPDMPDVVEFYAVVTGRRFSVFAGPGDDEVVLRVDRSSVR
jgi:hypothetical protein